MIPVLRAGLLAALAVVLGGCGLFGDKDDEDKPAELVDFDETLDVRRLWSAKVGKGSEFLRLALMPAGDGSRVYAASRNGVVTAYDPDDGDREWRRELDVALSAGPAVGEGLVVVGGADGDVVALAADDGSERWRVDIDGEVLAPPAIRGDSVVVVTIDGRLTVLSTFDGSERWSLEQQLPPLTLRGASAPAIVGTTVVAGFDNGRVLAVNLLDGTTEWEAVISPPTGRSDLERLADIDGTISVVGQDVYVTGYQGRLAALAAESGQVLWARELSTYGGVSADWNNVYTTTDTGEVVAFSRRAGAEAWRNDALLRREPTVPVPFERTVAVGDLEGYVHFISNIDGRFVARRRAGGGMISGAPAMIGGKLYVQNEDGTLTAFGVPPRDTQAVGDGA